ncbi:MAG: DUF1800 domain-containing protein [Acidimicrobiia bacterium]
MNSGGDTMTVATAPAATPAAAADPAERRRVARLFHRAGFGASVEEIDAWGAKGYTAAVDHLLAFAPAEGRPDDVEAAAIEASVPGGRIRQTDMSFWQRWWLDRMATTAYPLEEKLTLYWHRHFATGFSKVERPQLMLRQNRLFRHHAGGNFRALAKAVTADAAMLWFLDGNTNQNAALNENYGREFMELFTLGAGRYSQADVLEASRAFTGYTVDAQGTVTFNPALHDAGDKVIIGNRGKWGPEDVADIVLDRHPDGPVAAGYVAHRLAAFLHRPDPEPDVVAAMAGAFVGDGYAIKPMVRALLLRPEFSDGASLDIKSPVELVAGTIRALRLAHVPVAPEGPQRRPKSDGFAAATTDMGQELFDPPSVAGWDGGATWANTATMLSRYNFAAKVAKLVADDVVRSTLAASGGEPRDTPAAWMGRLGLIELLPTTTTSLERYLDGSAKAGTDPATRARGVLTLLLASPDYNLR